MSLCYLPDARQFLARTHRSCFSLAPSRARARASSRSHELSMVILGLNNTVKKRLDLAAKALANFLNIRVFGAGKQSNTRQGGGGVAEER